MYVSIEGNIGSGKTTLFNFLKQKYKDKIFIDEPINEWQNIKNSENINILELFYKNPKKWSFSFQICVLNTKLDKLKKIDLKNKNILSERSILTDKFCFAKQLYEDKNINHVDWTIYNNFYNNIDSDLYPKGIIYLNCSPETCLQRISNRNRNEESEIKLDYLENLHNKHSEWLGNVEIPILEINANENYFEDKNKMDNILINIEKFLIKFDL